jgi:hypothetical protein
MNTFTYLLTDESDTRHIFILSEVQALDLIHSIVDGLKNRRRVDGLVVDDRIALDLPAVCVGGQGEPTRWAGQPDSTNCPDCELPITLCECCECKTRHRREHGNS